MIVLLTGSNGFLGRHVRDRLLANTVMDEVILADNLEYSCGGRDEALYNRYSLDVSDFDAVEALFLDKKPTHVIHLAALGRNLNCQKWPLRAWEVNLMGTVNILEASRQNNIESHLSGPPRLLSDTPESNP